MADFPHRQARTWTKVCLLVPVEQTEWLAESLYTITGNGVEILENETTSGTRRLIGYINQDDEQAATESRIKDFYRDLLEKTAPEQREGLQLETLVEEDWNALWKLDFKPRPIGNRLIVLPSWEKTVPESDRIAVRIDPGMAFGTGLHATTQLALELIEECFDNNSIPERVLDVGTGTGILAITCALLGANEITATDLDPDAVHAAQENVQRNSVEHLVTVSDQDICRLSGPFNLVIANITHDVLKEMAPELSRLLAPAGKLILTGILQEQQTESLTATFTDLGLQQTAVKTKEEWSALLFSRESL